jgi:hypothetical protein
MSAPRTSVDDKASLTGHAFCDRQRTRDRSVSLPVTPFFPFTIFYLPLPSTPLPFFSMRTVLTTAERERERRLRADPLALVINSAFVECKQCGRKIKLSSKMAFDPLHWRNHRTRCVKRQKKKRGAMHSMVSIRLWYSLLYFT